MDNDGGGDMEYAAVCDQCSLVLMPDEYQINEDAAGGDAPHCPECGAQEWTFHPDAE